MWLALAAVIVFAAFAGCGADDDTAAGPNATSTSTRAPTTTTATNGGNDAPAAESSTTGEARAAAEAVLASTDTGEACGKYVTDHYLSVAYGGRRGCIQAQAPAGAADQLDFKSVRINGDGATTVVVPSGGPYDGERVTVSLVRQGPGWAVDALDANVPVGP